MSVCMHACMSIYMYVCIQTNSHTDAFRYIYRYVCPSIYRSATADGREGARHVEGTHRVPKRGCSTRVLKRGTHSCGETPSGACGRIRRIDGWAVLGSAVRTRSMGCVGWWQHSIGNFAGYSPAYPFGTHGPKYGQGVDRGVCSARIGCGRDAQQLPAVHGTTACLVCGNLTAQYSGFDIYIHVYVYLDIYLHVAVHAVANEGVLEGYSRGTQGLVQRVF
jgi:hypothetical protein